MSGLFIPSGGFHKAPRCTNGGGAIWFGRRTMVRRSRLQDALSSHAVPEACHQDICQAGVSIRAVSEARRSKAHGRAPCLRALSIQRLEARFW
jgi:hypothetical protein